MSNACTRMSKGKNMCAILNWIICGGLTYFFGKEHDKSSSEEPILKSIYTSWRTTEKRFIAENTKRKNQFFKENPQNENEFPLETTLFMLPLYELCVVKVR